MTGGNPQLVLRIPDSVGMILLADAQEEGVTIQELILRIVHEHYGVLDEFTPPRRGRPPAAAGDE